MLNHNDPRTYRAMAEPHASREAVEAEAEAFARAVAELRKTHKLREVVLVIESPYLVAEGEEADVCFTVRLGSPDRAGLILAQALGDMERARQEYLETARSGRKPRGR